MTVTVVAGGAAGALVSEWETALGGFAVPVDLDATPTLTIKAIPSGTAVYGPSAAGVGHMATGIYATEYAAPSSLTSGQYLALWEGLYGGNPVSASETLIVQPAVTTSTVVAIGATSQQQTKPYFSLGEFQTNRRRGVDVTRLVPGGGGTADNDAALMQIIWDASQRANDLCFQVLHATADTVTDQVRVDRDGYARIHPRYTPVIALTAFSIGSGPQNLAALGSLSGVGVKLNSFDVPVGLTVPLMSSQGPIQFGSVGAPMDGAWARYTYVNGYPHAFLTAAAAANDTSIAVDDTTGIIEGRTVLTVYAGRNRFTFTAGAVSTASNGLGYGAGTVGCPPLPYAVPNSDRYPTMVSALPGSFLDAVALIIRAIVKQSSVGNISASTTASGAQRQRDPLGAGDDMAAAEAILANYAAVVA
jgi:hypothetical protein